MTTTTRKLIKATSVAATLCAVAGAGLIAYGGTQAEGVTRPQAFTGTGTKKIAVNGHTINVSCTGTARHSEPVVMLLPGGGDGLDATADLQKTLSRKQRVCSYDRLGEGESDQPQSLQTMLDTGRILTGVLNRVTGDHPVILAGHSLGGYIAARYAPDHRDKVKGLVLMDATIPNLSADIAKAIPDSATGMPAELRDQTLAVNQGENPERFLIADGKVRSAGDMPVQIIKHESQYAEVPDYGPALEAMWSKGQHEWLSLSRNASLTTAKGSGHYIYVDRPDVAVAAIERVTDRVAEHGRNGRPRT
ncbi:alpha/beta fold hydrolase [Streptomyces sp. NPDC015032]|uniref:alpha/beta fold hydrolase n=1 Tax=Streptomyces sp. NPDC015032 TaxID=3364937 RepID=UPI0036F99AE4